MILMEYDEQKTMDYLRREAMEDGREEGREEGRILDLHNLMDTMNLTPEEAVKALKIPEEKRAYYIDKLKSKP
jgi:predicted transposase YdaD